MLRSDLCVKPTCIICLPNTCLWKYRGATKDRFQHLALYPQPSGNSLMHQMNTSRLIIKFMVSLRSHSSHCFKLHMLLIKTGWLNPQPVMLLGLRPQRLQHIRSSLLQHLRGLQGRSVPPHGPVRSYLC